MHDRLPPALRRSRRWGRAVARWALHAALPLLVVGAASGPGSGSASSIAAARSAASASGAVAASEPAAAAATFSARTSSNRLQADLLNLPVRRVIIDAGHGGDSRGTSGGGLEEKDVALDIATRMSRLVAAQGLDVVMTREGDTTVSLRDRAVLANTRRGDVFVSIHLNALQPASARGIETYYVGPSEGPEQDEVAMRENRHSGYSLSDTRTLLEKIFADTRKDESRQLARSVQNALVRAVRPLDPLTTDRGVKQAPFVVLMATEMPAILAEVSCLSNVDEVRRLGEAEYRQTIAEALVAGVMTFARTRG